MKKLLILISIFVSLSACKKQIPQNYESVWYMNGEEFKSMSFTTNYYSDRIVLKLVETLNGTLLNFNLVYYKKQNNHNQILKVVKFPVDSNDSKLVVFKDGDLYLQDFGDTTIIQVADTHGQAVFRLPPVKLIKQNYDSTGEPINGSDTLLIHGTFYEPFSKNYR